MAYLLWSSFGFVSEILYQCSFVSVRSILVEAEIPNAVVEWCDDDEESTRNAN